uniref:Nucleotide-diphospho-sugar transferase domain-containing protein n=3 Tax=Noccaea caerulescens TaxID=107243 RepID=A0A1J3JUF8_NOCCA
MSSSSSSSSSSSRRNFLDSRFAIGRKEVIRISILFLVFTASCLVLYKIVHPLQRLNLTSHLSSKSPLSDLNSSEISLETTEQKIILKEILEKASTNNKTVIITTLNQAWAEPKSIFDLFLESFRIGQGTQQLLKHVVVVCLDPKAFERCSQLHLNCYQIETSDADFSGDKAYNTPDYVKMMWRRIELLIRVLEMGFNFIFTDADVMWLRDPFPRLYPDGDFQMACDKFFGNPLSLDNFPNGGFVYVKSNNRSIEFYKFWYKSRLKWPWLHDQDVFIQIKHDPVISEIGVQIRFFDTVYVCGFCQPSTDINLICTMHGNCCLGTEKKLHDLNLVLDDWRKYTSLSKHVENTTWSVPMKCLEN